MPFKLRRALSGLSIGALNRQNSSPAKLSSSPSFNKNDTLNNNYKTQQPGVNQEFKRFCKVLLQLMIMLPEAVSCKLSLVEKHNKLIAFFRKCKKDPH